MHEDHFVSLDRQHFRRQLRDLDLIFDEKEKLAPALWILDDDVRWNVLERFNGPALLSSSLCARRLHSVWK